MHEKIINNLNKTINLFIEGLPDSVVEINKTWNTNYFAYIKAYIGVIYLCLLRIPISRKYAFQTFRNREIIECLNPEEILILGGRQYFSACRKQNYKLIWTGGIMAAVVVASRAGHTLPLRLQIRLAKRVMQGSKKYIFLYEDTTPLGIFFAIFANDHAHISICIQHGTPSVKELFLDGLLCQYNLLYQLGYKDDMNPDSIYFELGPPFDAEVNDDISSTLILVGTGLQGLLPAFYSKSLDCYQQIKNLMQPLGWNVVYRPHPAERPINYSSHFSNVDTSSNGTCLSGARKIFIGYQSSLLYEAQAFGHAVITLIDPDVFKIKLFIPDIEIDATCLGSIASSIIELHSDMKNRPIRNFLRLKERFLQILGEIELQSERN